MVSLIILPTQWRHIDALLCQNKFTKRMRNGWKSVRVKKRRIKCRNFRRFFTASSENMTLREIVSDLDITVADFNGANGFSEKHLHFKHPCLTQILFESTNLLSFLIKSRLHPLGTIIFNNWNNILAHQALIQCRMAMMENEYMFTIVICEFYCYHYELHGKRFQ